MSKNIHIFLFLNLMLLLSSCESPTESPLKDPLWERQSCDACRMVLSEKRYALQKVLESGEIRYYDDFNCALRHNHEPGILYVRPHGSDIWAKAEKARFRSGLFTPMNSGIGAVMTGGDLSFEEAKKRIEERL